jgi:hypothetical protein
LHESGERCFKYGTGDTRDLEVLTKEGITATSYQKLPKLIANNDSEIAELEKSLSQEQTELKSAADTLTTFERIAGGVYIQSIIEAESNRRQSDYIGSGVKSADTDEKSQNYTRKRGIRK